ncbi:MAG: holo-ACP synthase [Elusimicrobia bacterium]|nr:holo-ACP synthase [Elusimicrobiota bacterium]
MKIIGTGVDIVEITRIKQAGKNKKFLERVFSPEELDYSLKSKKKWERLAVRFAAKEAVWKAIGSSKIILKDISVKRMDNGKPFIDLKSLGLSEGWKASLSLSHSDHYAVAYCLVYQE